MAAKFHFFTDTDLLSIPQPSSDAFGPAGTDNSVPQNDQYRVSSMHSASSNPTAYAICNGIVCAQDIPNTLPALVNLILMPLDRPSINFVPIRYYVYKSILKDSLFADAPSPAPPGNYQIIAPPGNNQLTQTIWKSQNDQNTSANTPNAPAPAAALGIDLTAANQNYADNMPIDNLFFRTGGDAQFPVVKGGWSIGTFDKTPGHFGFQILLEGLGFLHNLDLTRQKLDDDYIRVPTLTGLETLSQQFDHWHAKEQVLGYMDPCAFYGSFFLAGIQAKTSTPNSNFVTKSGNTLYNDVLSAFNNKNTAYLDIRNEHNFSFNYFGNYTQTLQTPHSNIKLNNITTPVDYYGSKWPILTLPASSFLANNTGDARNAFRIQMPVGDNPKPLLYISQGYRDIGKQGSFPAELKQDQQFYDAFQETVSGALYTALPPPPKKITGLNSMRFVVPNVTGLGSTTPVSCYIRLKYLKQEQGATTVQTVIQSSNYLDNLIYPIDLSSIPFTGASSIKTFVYDEEIYVNAQDVPGLEFDFIGKIGIARDANNTSFFLMPTNVRKPVQASMPVTLSGETSDYPGSFPNFVALKYPLEEVLASNLVGLPGTPSQVPIAEFKSTGTSAEQAKFNVPDFDKFFVVVVANSAYDSWTHTRISPILNDKFRVYLGVKNLQPPPVQTDGSGVEYTSFELVLRGYAIDSNGNYKVQEMTTDPLTTDPLTATNVKQYFANIKGD